MERKRDKFYVGPATKAVILSLGRSGSLFLCHCLSNHPQVFCWRGSVRGKSFEIRHARSITDVAAIRATWAARSYRAAVAKLGYKPPLNVMQEVRDAGAKAIHLERKNVLRAFISAKVYRASRAGITDHPAHTFKRVLVDPVLCNAKNIISGCQRRLRLHADMVDTIAQLGISVLNLTYEELVGGEGNEVTKIIEPAAKRLREFLGVGEYPFYTLLRRVNPYPLSEIVSNWDEVRPAIEKSEFAWCLEEES